MSRDRAYVSLRVHHEAPPAFVRRWMTDLRDDDPLRFFGEAAAARVVHETPERAHSERDVEDGLVRLDVRWEGTNGWVSDGLVARRGRAAYTLQLREDAQPEGDGTAHRVELRLEPATPLEWLRLRLARSGWRRYYERALDRMARGVHDDWRATQDAPVDPSSRPGA